MKALTIFAIYASLAYSQTSLADEATQVNGAKGTMKGTAQEGFQTLDMHQFKDMDATKTGNSRVKFSSGCKSKTGTEYKAGEVGYEACLREVQTDQVTNTKSGASPSVGVSFGN